MKKTLVFTLFLMLFLLLSACQPPLQGGEEKSFPFTEIVSGDLSKVTHLTIRSGSTGELRTLIDQEKVKAWLEKLKTTQWVKDPHQEKRTGWLYAVTFYEGERQILVLFPNQINGIYYLSDDLIRSCMKELFEMAKPSNDFSF